MEDNNILQSLIYIHNNIISIPVNGDNVIKMGDSIKILRKLINEMQNDKENEGE